MRTWKKRLAGIFFALFPAVLSVSAGLPLSVAAADDMPRLVDRADLLSDGEESELSDRLDEISERQQVDIVVVTADSMEGETAATYADDFYDENGYGFGDGRDGILFLISMEERDWYISTRGYGITAVTDAGRAYMSEILVNDLRAGNYRAAFMSYAELCDDFVTQARNGAPYDTGNLPRKPFEVVWNLAVAFGTALLLSLIVTGIMRGQLKSVKRQSAADDYMKRDSMQMTKKEDLFLYRHVAYKKKAESSSANGPGGSETHTSSSGATHGGGGGKF